MRVMLKPVSSCSSVTSAVVLRSSGGWPASLSRLASDIVKQPASAAAISSSGLVARSTDSTLAFSVNGPSKAPLPSPMRPPPSGTVPCQLASDLRVTRTPKVLLLSDEHDAADAADTRAPGCTTGPGDSACPASINDG